MNTRRLFREYAKSKGKEAVKFIKLKKGFFETTVLITEDSKGYWEETPIYEHDWEDMVYWIQKTYLKNIKLED